ncbi:hypothetical protein ASPVEDRAFT_56188 [Aspergillus versicolor CBS 583.65]|uniref:Uncharacterized protein n=1 Tax=Aspergillus versicolor CBS 583.65 TaxID=1036611 RepID=A0A1L9PYH8_ASPVE|nr:uncharacterized protein ASPVEDRAFT_56188 [Aspergillus versicolor CBS 583.65]OJJ06601.1 hypothetical protein ASPVEDRAFT_56188 [Aspergillus versicolor CBS 583.65]
MAARALIASLAATAAATPLVPGATKLAARDVIDHDAVVGFDETVPEGTTGEQYLAYQPYLYVEDGCVPFPAVDAEGNTSGGLEPSGGSSSNCDSSPGQVYARSTMSDGSVSTYGAAIMYSWYMPKDSPSTGLGHRNDWEGVVVWLNDESSTAVDNIAAVCPSAHGEWNCDTEFTLDGSRPLIKYSSTWPVNHQLDLTDEIGGTQPLVAWESLPDVARQALQDADFGDATVPLKDETFGGNLESATY